ncbi:MAG: hypothetical protein AAF567_04750 [Actinomycetota bacterium]
MHDHERMCELVTERLRTTLGAHVGASALAGPTSDLLDGVDATFRRTSSKNLVAVHVPLAFAVDEPIHSGEDLVGVAAACAAIYVGGRMLDDLMDGHDLSYFEEDRSAPEVIGWVTMLATLPPILLTNLGVGSETRVKIINEFGAGLVHMLSGQMADAASGAAGLPTPERAMEAIRGKTGAMIGTFARAAARTVCVPEAGDTAADAAWRFGMGIGVGRQLLADRAKLASSDRRTDRMTPPYLVAVHGAALEGDARYHFVDLVSKSRTDTGARTEVAQAIAGSPAIAQVALTAELELASAEASLARLPVEDEVTGRLQSMIDLASPF